MSVVKIDWRRCAVQSKRGEVVFHADARCFRAVCKMRFGAIVPHDELRDVFGSHDRAPSHLRNMIDYLRKRLAPIGVCVRLDKSGRFKDDGGYFLEAVK